MRHEPWGEARYAWAASLTTTPAYELTRYTFTGQYSYMDDPSTSGVTEGFGLMFYNARWYDPSLGRFAQADTIVPGGVQGWDRYAYVNNAPVRFTDPSGHEICMDGGYCGEYHGQAQDPLSYWKGLVKEKFGVTFSGNWSSKSVSAMYFALFNMNNKFNGTLKSLINGAIFLHENKAAGTYGGATWLSGAGITFRFAPKETAPNQNVYHEVAHLIDIRFGDYFTDTLDGSSIYTEDGDFVMGRRNGNYDRQVGIGYSSRNVCDPHWSGCSIDAEQHPGTINSTSAWGQSGNTADEEWGDLVANYVSGNISNNGYGAARANWLNTILNTFFALPVNAR
ncbi:MAG: RHS repeat-associated core domain-containing protein [Chloroflexota bacterium]